LNASDLIVSNSGKYLYSITDDGVKAFKILPDGDLQPLNEMWTGGMRGCYLDVDEQVGLDRLSSRNFKDRLDQESIDFHHRVAQGYQEVLRRFKDRIRIVDASRGKEEVIADSLNRILELING
ncbi:MAG: hypothetical protein IIW22_07085, partial [Erysipelotrichaceae bacterium]|nr:hypothetical protein [Erysipelotrichaceae bacterium]